MGECRTCRSQPPLGGVRTGLVFGMLLLAAFTADSEAAQADEHVSATILDIDDTTFPEVRAILTIVESGGRPIEQITADAITAEETGMPGEVINVDRVLDEKIGVGVILTIDASGSMFGLPITQAKSAASAFVRDLQSTDQTAVISFSANVTIEDTLSSDRSSALEALNSLSAQGDTALYEAVARSIQLAQDVPLPRKAIILLSDGVDFGGLSGTTREQSLSQARAARVPIYVIGLGTGVDREYLEALAEGTGGAFLETPTPNGISELYGRLSELLRSQYIVTVRSTAPAHFGDRSLTLNINTPGGPTEVSLEYKTKRTILPTPFPSPVPSRILPPPTSSEEGRLSSTLLLLLLASLVLVTSVFGVRYGLTGIRNLRVTRNITALSQRAAVETGNRLAIAGDNPAGRPAILVIDGPDGTQRHRIEHEPVTIGTGTTNEMRIGAAGGDIAEEHARVWMRDGRLVFHHLAPGYRSTVHGEAVTWVSLDDGDELQIGTYKLRLQMERD